MKHLKGVRFVYAVMTASLVSLYLSIAGCSSNVQVESSGSAITDQPSIDMGSSTHVEEELFQEIVCADEITVPERFSDGVAWVDISDRGKVLIDDQGVIQFCLEELEGKGCFVNATRYVNGAAVAYERLDSEMGGRGNGIFSSTLIDKQGEVIWAVKEDGIEKARQVYGEEAVDRVGIVNIDADLWRGYLAVAFHVDSFSYTGTLFGVIDAQGEWCVEPPTIDEVLARQEDGINPGIDDGDDGWWSTDPELLLLPYSDSYMYNEAYLKILNDCIFLYRTGESIPCTHNAWSNYEYGGMSQRDIEDREFTLAHRNRRSSSSRFLDSEGNEVFSLKDVLPDSASSWRVDYFTAFAESDYAFVLLENDGGGKYLTAIDTEGNIMFEPLKAGEHGTLSEDLFYYCEPGAETGRYYSVETGQPIFDVEVQNGLPFYEGKAWAEIDDVWHLIDTSGDVLI